MKQQAFSPWSDHTKFQDLYTQLRSIARARMAHNAGHTLSPTGLVNEAMAKMLSGQQSDFNSESHFIATAATAMRHILVDHARRKTAAKRIDIDPGPMESDPWINTFELSPEATLDIHRELETLSAEQPELARVVELRVFGGLTFAEIGALLGMETKTAERRWRYVSALLRSKLDL